MKSFLPLTLCAIFLVSGDATAEHIISPELVIMPGYKMWVDSQSVSVAGSDECYYPDQVNSVVYIPSYKKDENNSCIAIFPFTEKVSVIVYFPKGPLVEVWTVEHKSDRMSLRRKDGSLITEWGKSTELVIPSRS